MAKKPTISSLKNTEGFDRFDDVFKEFKGDTVASMTALKNHKAAFLFKTASGIQLKLTFLRHDIVQFNYTFRNNFSKEPLYA